MNEAEYLMKNYGDRGGCYRPRRITPSESAISLQSQRVSQQRQRKATNQYLLQGHILYPLHGVHLQRTVQRQLLRQVRAIYFN